MAEGDEGEALAERDCNGRQFDFKQKYKLLKNKLKFLVYEHEALLDDLKRSQKKLLRVSRDRSFLLDRLLAHEKVEDSSSEDDVTVTSQSDTEKATPVKIKRKSGPVDGVDKVKKREGTKAGEPLKKKMKTMKKGKAGSGLGLVTTPKGASTPQLSREEIERHLESRPRLMALEKAPLHVPAEIFSNEASNLDSDDATSDNDLDHSDLVIDSKWCVDDA